MSQLTDIKALGDDLLPIVKDLFDLAKQNGTRDDKAAEIAAISKLKKITAEANQPTRGDLLSTLQTLNASKDSLGEIIIRAREEPGAIPETTVRIVEARHTALGASFGRLLAQSAFAGIPALLDTGEIDAIGKSLDQADDGIKQRQLAKDILDITVDVALTSAKIAMRLA